MRKKCKTDLETKLVRTPQENQPGRFPRAWHSGRLVSSNETGLAGSQTDLGQAPFSFFFFACFFDACCAKYFLTPPFFLTTF
jgi:hypothetical protein